MKIQQKYAEMNLLKKDFITKQLLLLLTFLMVTAFGWGQHFTESFENPDTWSGYTTGTVTFDSGNWEFVEVFPEDSTNSQDGSKACRINDDTANASITSPSVNGVGTISFYYHRPFTGTGSLLLQKSVNGGVFTTLSTVDFSNVTTPTLYSFEVNDSSSNIKIRIVNDNNSAHLTIDYFVMGELSGPTISTTPTTLTGFTYVEGSGPSAEQSFNVTGSSLEADIDLITGNDNHLFAAISGGPYSTSLTLAESGGSVNATVYVILKSGLVAGTYADTVVCASTNATDTDVSVDGTVDALAPDIQLQIPIGTDVACGSTYDFGTQNTGPGTDQTLRILNSGTSDLSITSYPLSGTNADEFPISPASTNTTIAAGEFYDITVSFSPTTAGSKTAEITINSDDADEATCVINLTGNVLSYVPCDTTIITGSIIYIQDFEASGGYTTSETEFSDNNKDYFIRSDGSNHTETYDNPINSYYFAAQDLDGEGPVTFPLTLDISNIDITNASNLILKVYLAEDPGLGWDDNDYVKINYEIDNNGFQNGVWVRNDGSQYNTRAQIDTDYDGVGDGAQLTSTFTQFTKTIAEIGSTMNIKIEFNLDSGDEDIAIDYIEIVGDKTTPISTTWNGTAWSDAAPTNTKKAIINGSLNITTQLETCECQVNVGAILTVKTQLEENQPTHYLLVEGDIVNNGTIVVEDNASLVQHDDAATITGTGFKIHKKTRPYHEYDYTYWSSPVVGETIGNVFDTHTSVMQLGTGSGHSDLDQHSLMSHIYWFDTSKFNDADDDTYDDEQNAWTFASAGDIMEKAKGYAAMGAGSDWPFSTDFATDLVQSLYFEGQINNGAFTYPIVADNNNSDDFNNENLVGNPYPSAINLQLLRNDPANQIEGNPMLGETAWFWSHETAIVASSGPQAYNFSNSDYATLNITTNVGTAAHATSPTPDKFWASCQAILLEADQAGELYFNNSMRVTDENDNFFKNSSEDKLWLNMTNDTGLFRQIAIVFMEGADDTINDFDSKKIFFIEETDFYSLSTASEEKLAIQGLAPFDEEKTIQLGVKIVEDGTYEIAIDHLEGIFGNGQNVYIEDAYRGKIHNLSDGAYTFYSIAQDDDVNNRFVLRFTYESLELDQDKVFNYLSVYPNPSNSIFYIGISNQQAINIQVFDLSGKELINLKNTTNRQIDLTNYHSGFYFVKISQNGQHAVKKLILK